MRLINTSIRLRKKCPESKFLCWEYKKRRAMSSKETAIKEFKGETVT